MTIKEAVQSVFSKYATFNGRARRAEYWKWCLFSFIVSVIISIVGGIVGSISGNGGAIVGWIDGIWSIAIIVPSLALEVRRLHDIGKSGWWLLLALIPCIGGIILLVFDCTDSKPGANKYGPNPKGIN